MAGSRNLGVWQTHPRKSGHDTHLAIPGPLGLRTHPDPAHVALERRGRHAPAPRLGRFLQDAGWPSPAEPSVAARMEMALAFFETQFGDAWCQAALDENAKGYQQHGFSPWSCKIAGKATKLTSAMQAIDFSEDVTLRPLSPGDVVRHYRRPSDKIGFSPWYTTPEISPNTLALYPDQKIPQDYTVLKAITILQSKAGDLLVDWNMEAPAGQVLQLGHDETDIHNRTGDYFYRKGGGVQLTIPNAVAVLRPVPIPSRP